MATVARRCSYGTLGTWHIEVMDNLYGLCWKRPWMASGIFRFIQGIIESWIWGTELPSAVQRAKGVLEFPRKLKRFVNGCIKFRCSGGENKKLSYCWETVRRESMP